MTIVRSNRPEARAVIWDSGETGAGAMEVYGRRDVCGPEPNGSGERQTSVPSRTGSFRDLVGSGAVVSLREKQWVGECWGRGPILLGDACRQGSPTTPVSAQRMGC